MIKKIAFLTSFFLVFNLFGQEVVATDGDYSSATSGSLSWTLGEIVVATTESPSGILTQGFQQDFENILAVAENGWLLFNIYPNPFQQELTIQVSDNKTYSLSIINNQSKKVFEKQLEYSNVVKIDLSFLNSGVYFIDIQRNDSLEHFFKTLVKIN